MNRREQEQFQRQSERQVAKIAELEGRLEAVRKHLTRLYEPHTKPMTSDIRLGNPLPSQWWCSECRRPFPCDTMLDLRDVHSATYGGPGLPRERTPLELTFVPKNRVKP